MKLQTKRVVCLTVLVASILTIVGTVSYAYFSARPTGNDQTATINTATVAITFDDNDAGIGGEISLGETKTKKFTVTNTGTVEAYYKIYWENLVNTFTYGSLSYTLSYSDTPDGTYTEAITKTSVPQSIREADKVLASVLSIPVGATHYYNLTITYDYLDDVDQTKDYEATFNSTFRAEDIHYSPSLETLKKLKVPAREETPNFDIPAPAQKHAIVEGESFSGSTDYIKEKYVTYGDSYTFDETTGQYTLNEPKVCKYSECYETLKGKYLSGSSETSEIKNDPVSGVPRIDEASLTNMTITEFGSELSYNYSEDGVYSMEDDYGTSYYYRGAIENNYVMHANDLWRIVRVNGDGSLRVIKEDDIDSAVWNESDDDAKYAGYMFGGKPGEASTSKSQAQKNETDSTIKEYLDGWYEFIRPQTDFESYLSDTLFCNDRSTVSTPSSLGTTMGDTGLGYGDNITVFGFWNRFDETGDVGRVSNIRPTLKCNRNDAFTVGTDQYGNGALTYPIGLITADEVVLAGGSLNGENIDYYLYNSNTPEFWTLSPVGFDNNTASMTIVSSGGLNSIEVTGQHITRYDGPSIYVRPVINLSKKFIDEMHGSGTREDPFRTYDPQ